MRGSVGMGVGASVDPNPNRRDARTMVGVVVCRSEKTWGASHRVKAYPNRATAVVGVGASVDAAAEGAKNENEDEPVSRAMPDAALTHRCVNATGGYASVGPDEIHEGNHGVPELVMSARACHRTLMRYSAVGEGAGTVQTLVGLRTSPDAS